MDRNERFARTRAAARLTEGQLADLVADRIAASTGRRPPIDADHVSRIERGLITWPGRDYRAAFRAVLGAASDADLGLHCRRVRPIVAGAPVDVDGQLLALAGAATVGGLTSDTLGSLAAGLGGPRMPNRVGRADVADLNHVIDGMERADHAAGGRTVVRTVALTQLSWAQDTLRLSSFRAADVRIAWMTAVARLGRLAGFMSMDAREHRTARQAFLIALHIAAEAGCRLSRFNVLSGMARQAVHLKDGRSALLLAELAQAGGPAAGVTMRAVGKVLEARAYGLLGRPAEAVAAVDAAEDCYARRSPEDDPPWLWFYDEAQLLGDTGHALYPLALNGTDVDALRRLKQAVGLHADADPRGRAFSLIKLATLEARFEPGREALTTAERAIAAAADLRSGRALDHLTDLGRALRRGGGPEAKALAGQVSGVLRAARRS